MLSLLNKYAGNGVKSTEFFKPTPLYNRQRITNEENKRTALVRAICYTTRSPPQLRNRQLSRHHVITGQSPTLKDNSNNKNDWK